MAKETDPARELYDLIKSLALQHDQRLDNELARHFDVAPWSSEFFQIVFTISSRIDELIALTDEVALDQDLKAETKAGLQTIQTAFGTTGLHNASHHTMQSYFSDAYVAPLRGLSGLVRPLRSYPKLDEVELAEIIDLVDQLLDWLNEHQLSEQDFIREAIIVGLSTLRFRLTRIHWLGWGFALQSLKDVIYAYFALERGFPEPDQNTTAAASLKKIHEFVKQVFEKTNFIKEGVETGDFMLRAFGAVHLAIAGKQTVAGLITYLPN